MQTLKIDGFLGIYDSTIEICPVTVIIGEQATGKSIVARLLYFFNEYFANFDELSLSNNERKTSYDKKKREEFINIFPSYSWEKSKFSITYENADHSITLTSEKNSAALKLTTSSSVALFFSQLKKDYNRFSKEYKDQPVARTRLLREFRYLHSESGNKIYESALFVPAARAFYATIRDEIFSILALDNKIDQIILQFGEFYETAKMRQKFERARRNKKLQALQQKEDEYFSKVVKGKLIKDDGRDWLEMDRGGRIEMSRASSGQQEATPLLMAISQYPNPGRTLIIEEPEAHLFPTAQVSILDFILSQSIEKDTSILFTTHSPYILSALNNYLVRDEARLENSFPLEKLRAYCISNGKVESIVDKEVGLISADYIDSISDEISTEFERAIEALNGI